MNPKIRPAKSKDLPVILSLLADLSKTKPDQKASLKVFSQILKSDFYFTFVATVGDKIAGTASVLLFPSLQHGRPWGLIDNVVVARKYQRKGIGKKLTEALISFAKKKDCYKVVLTARFTRTGAHQFWQKAGFKKHGFSFRMDL